MESTPWFIEPLLWTTKRDLPRGRELHYEIVEFYEKESPKETDYLTRSEAFQRVETKIKSLWPFCEVKVFGSFATGMYLPRISDIDIVIVGSGDGSVLSKLFLLGRALRSWPIAKDVEVISRAKVPIVKFTESSTSIRFDARFDDSPKELLAAQVIVNAASEFPALPPLYIFLKMFLHVHGLNEVYHTGGLASYTLFVMLYTFLQIHPYGHQACPTSVYPGLGYLLASFFHFYGRSLNVYQYGISCRNHAHFFLKEERGFVNHRKPYLLAVEDPIMPTNDIGKNSFNFPGIQATFSESYQKLTSGRGSGSLLGLILPGWLFVNTYK